jgi:hypothetical protein
MNLESSRKYLYYEDLDSVGCTWLWGFGGRLKPLYAIVPAASKNAFASKVVQGD